MEYPLDCTFPILVQFVTVLLAAIKFPTMPPTQSLPSAAFTFPVFSQLSICSPVNCPTIPPILPLLVPSPVPTTLVLTLLQLIILPSRNAPTIPPTPPPVASM